MKGGFDMLLIMALRNFMPLQLIVSSKKNYVKNGNIIQMLLEGDFYDKLIHHSFAAGIWYSANWSRNIFSRDKQNENKAKTKHKSINIYVVVERKFQNHRICLKNDKHAKCSEFKTVRKAINCQFKTITFSLQYKPAKFSGTLIPVDAQLKTDQ